MCLCVSWIHWCLCLPDNRTNWQQSQQMMDKTHHWRSPPVFSPVTVEVHIPAGNIGNSSSGGFPGTLVSSPLVVSVSKILWKEYDFCSVGIKSWAVLWQCSVELTCWTRFTRAPHRCLVVRRPPREWKVPGSNPACAGIFSGSSHTSDLNIGTPVTTLPGAWRDRVSTGTGLPDVSILWLGEVESLICNFYLSVAARKIVWADPSLRYTRMLLGR